MAIAYADRKPITQLARQHQAARALKTDYKTLHLKMKSLGLKARDFDA